MLNWIGYTMKHFGKLDSTYELDQPLHESVTFTSPEGVTMSEVTSVHKWKTSASTGSRVKMSRLTSLVPPGIRPRTVDAGEILTDLRTLLGQESMIDMTVTPLSSNSVGRT
jgi:hypothetical protein